jgi:hypothetical protein
MKILWTLFCTFIALLVFRGILCLLVLVLELLATPMNRWF